MKIFFYLLMIFFVSNSSAVAHEDFTGGKDLGTWIWEDQFKPTIQKSYDTTGLSILVAGVAATAVSHQYDDTARRHNEDPERRIFDRSSADLGGYLGSGGPGIAIALAQIYFDTENGWAHSRAIALTAANHITFAALIHRQRPNGRDHLSMPSGHASSSFATATSLAYAYGWKVGVPAYLTAGFIAATRVSENIHWTSDVIAAAALGIFWGRASHLVAEDRKVHLPLVLPVVTEQGPIVMAHWSF